MKRKMIAIVATALCAVLAVPALAFGVGNLSAGQAIVASDAPAQTVAWRGYVDADGDGVVTMEEYQEYCKENGISTDEQAAEMQSRGDAMIKKQAEEAPIAYDDYIKYCEENGAGAVQNSGKVESSGVNDAGLVIRNVGKALSSYSGNQIKLPEAKIERNA